MGIKILFGVTTIGGDVFQDADYLTIYTEHTPKPDDWHDDWNSSDRPVH